METTKAPQTSSIGQKATRVAVIGAGASGLCAAKWMLDAGMDVSVYEVGSHVGGIWVYENDSGLSPAYKTLCINSDKRTTQFDDFPMGEDVALFPHHREMSAYLENYAHNFGVYDRVRFGTRVTEVLPEENNSDQPMWRVQDEHGGSETFDAVIVASGHAWSPRHPMFAPDFTGEYLHSFYYRDPVEFVNKRICVVGGGNSAFDIASDVAVTADRTVMAVRSGVNLIPKMVFGKPVIELRESLGKWWIPSFVQRLTIKTISRALLGDIDSLGFKRPTKWTRPSSNATLTHHIAFRRIEVKPGIVNIVGSKVEFEDGSAEEFDTLIAATGYLIDVPFISQNVLAIGEGNVPLFKRIVAVDRPGLYFIGLLQYEGSFFEAFDAQAKWIRELICGDCRLPGREAMTKDIEMRDRYTLDTFSNSPRHYLEEISAHYLKELRKETRRGQRRRRRMSQQR